MTDPDTERAEQALRDALGRRAETLAPRDLRVRSRRSRRLALLVAVAAVVVAVVGVGAVVAVRRTDGSGPRDLAADPATPSVSSSAQSSDVRTVGIGSVLVDVPASWGDASEPDPGGWCVTPASPLPQKPYVADGNGISMAVGCRNPTTVPEGFPQVPERLWAPHLSLVPLSQASSSVVDGTTTYRGWTLTRRTVDGVVVSLLTDAATAADVPAVMASARSASTDPNGCETASPVGVSGFPRPEPDDVSAVTEVTSITVCLYARSTPGEPAGLLGSRVLRGSVAHDELDAVRAAPAGGGPDAPGNCVHDQAGDQMIELGLHTPDGGTHQLFAYYDWCFGNGIDDGVTRRAITVADCSPLWGGRVQQYSGDGSTYALCHPDR